jgi:hypothetical protein
MTSNSIGWPYVGQAIEKKNFGETPEKLASFLFVLSIAAREAKSRSVRVAQTV